MCVPAVAAVAVLLLLLRVRVRRRLARRALGMARLRRPVDEDGVARRALLGLGTLMLGMRRRRRLVMLLLLPLLVLLNGLLVELELLLGVVLLFEAGEEEVDELLETVDLVLTALKLILVRAPVGRLSYPDALVPSEPAAQARRLSRALHLADSATACVGRSSALGEGVTVPGKNGRTHFSQLRCRIDMLADRVRELGLLLLWPYVSPPLDEVRRGYGAALWRAFDDEPAEGLSTGGMAVERSTGCVSCAYAGERAREEEAREREVRVDRGEREVRATAGEGEIGESAPRSHPLLARSPFLRAVTLAPHLLSEARPRPLLACECVA